MNIKKIKLEDVKWKQYSDINQGPGHNSVENNEKIICNCPYLHFVNINAFTNFYQNLSIGPQDIEHK